MAVGMHQLRVVRRDFFQNMQISICSGPERAEFFLGHGVFSRTCRLASAPGPNEWGEGLGARGGVPHWLSKCATGRKPLYLEVS